MKLSQCECGQSRMGMTMKDAAGNTPAPLTSYEKKWRNKVQSGDLNKGYDLLRKRQTMPLQDKVDLSLERIREWYEAFDGQVAVSYSGGKDSAVLLHLARKLYPDLPAVFCNTGLEYMEKLGLARVLDYIHNNCPDRNIAKKFVYGEYIKETQIDLFPEMGAV